MAREPVAPWWVATWPLGEKDWIRIALSFAAVVTVFIVAGVVLTDWLAPNVVTELDVELAERLADSRTEQRDDFARWAAFPADTGTKVIATAALVLAAIARWRRWHEAVLLAGSLIFEATAFVITSHVVGRARPDVPRLLDSPVDTSFPSGHVAAAAVYLAIAVIVAWHTRSRWAPLLAVVGCGLVVGAVALARMYQGMHYLSDVVAAAVLGLITVAIWVRLIPRPDRAGPGPAAESASKNEDTATADDQVLDRVEVPTP